MCARACLCVCVKAWWGMLLWTSNAVAASESESAIAIVHICCICVCTHAGDSLSESGTIHNMECLYEIYLQFLLEGCDQSQFKLTNRHKHEKQKITAKYICHREKQGWGMKLFLGGYSFWISGDNHHKHESSQP